MGIIYYSPLGKIGLAGFLAKQTHPHSLGVPRALVVGSMGILGKPNGRVCKEVASDQSTLGWANSQSILTTQKEKSNYTKPTAGESNCPGGKVERSGGLD